MADLDGFHEQATPPATYGADLSNNAGRKGDIRSWAAGFASTGRPQAQFARSTKELRIALVDAVADVFNVMKETPVDQPLILVRFYPESLHQPAESSCAVADVARPGHVGHRSRERSSREPHPRRSRTRGELPPRLLFLLLIRAFAWFSLTIPVSAAGRRIRNARRWARGDPRTAPPAPALPPTIQLAVTSSCSRHRAPAASESLLPPGHIPQQPSPLD